MKDGVKLDTKSCDVARELPPKSETETSGNLRIYVANPVLLERLASAAQRDGAEVCEFLSAETMKKSEAQRPLPGNRSEILVMSSSGAIWKDLQQMREAKEAIKGLKILLLLPATQSETELLQYLRAGIGGLLPAEAGAEEVISAACAISNGQGICSGDQCSMLFRYFEKDATVIPFAALRRDLGLTRREQQLIPFLTRGLTNKEIANHFSLSEQTVKNHLYRMKRKVGAQGRLEIVDVCRRHGFPS
ncbi:MAG TPA: LuxR C-terminal-related transcriptional regulator [Candidatus Eremiobacteraceae bacterium]|nr:LuxR C-terminal-related transcriptional regulator [Candidatus Eremiobacteraceae bacterium]